ncbi:MAG TPA: hypothetical protein VND95_15930 [Stellaceae bacterium]|nr:hypothetical protein [Stellaceae bacterium]
MTTYFCDGIKEVTILNGVARLEFHRLQAPGTAGPNRDLQAVTELFIALPAQGLLQALAILEQVRERLIKDGLLQPAATEPAGGLQPVPATSPNFA